MKLIALSGKYGSIIGNVAKVDDEDYEYLMQWKWYALKSTNNKFYARYMTKERVIIHMHREIMKISDPNVFIDHADGNGLNNQRTNLREATNSQNQANRESSKKKYKGVYMKRGHYHASCKKDGIAYGRYCKTEVEAAIAYNVIALGLFGEYAKLNTIQDVNKE